MDKFIFKGSLIAILFLAILLFLAINNFKSESALKKDLPLETVAPSPSTIPLPFQELTIPYLRSRTYDSNLSELKEYSKNNQYIAYLTSFNSDGYMVNGLLTIPQGNIPQGGYPAIIFVHGYIPPTEYKTEANYSTYVDYLAKNGFVVFKVDLRGHGDSEGQAMGAYYSGDYVIDVLNAYSALQNADFVNPNKIGLWGHSMGGNVVMRSFVVNKSVPAVVIWAGAVYSYDDMRKYGIEDNSYRPPVDNTTRQQYREQLRQAHGEYDGSNQFWQMVPPVNYLDGVNGAVQIHHALDDKVVSIGYSRDLMHFLDKTSIPHQLQEYSFGGHNIEGASFSQAMDSTVQFFNKYLQ